MKEDVKKRLGKSPDRADAVIMSLLNWKDTEGADRLMAGSAKPLDLAKLYGDRAARPLAHARMGVSRRQHSWMSV